jgi:hypothetical protein
MRLHLSCRQAANLTVVLALATGGIARAQEQQENTRLPDPVRIWCHMQADRVATAGAIIGLDSINGLNFVIDESDPNGEKPDRDTIKAWEARKPTHFAEACSTAFVVHSRAGVAWLALLPDDERARVSAELGGSKDEEVLGIDFGVDEAAVLGLAARSWAFWGAGRSPAGSSARSST